MRYSKLHKLSLVAPFACKEVFWALGSLLKALPLLKDLSVSFIFTSHWKDWFFAETEWIEIEALAMPIFKEP